MTNFERLEKENLLVEFLHDMCTSEIENYLNYEAFVRRWKFVKPASPVISESPYNLIADSLLAEWCAEEYVKLNDIEEILADTYRGFNPNTKIVDVIQYIEKRLSAIETKEIER